MQFLSTGSCVTEWRVRRAALFMRLLSSPSGSLTQVALLALHQAQSEWFVQAVNDLRVVDSAAAFETHDGPPRILPSHSQREFQESLPGIPPSTSPTYRRLGAGMSSHEGAGG
jgi:hypothetical protein